VAEDHDADTAEGNGRNRRESEKLDGLYSASCALLLDLLPELLVEQRPLPPPAALLQATRWVKDSRDEANRRTIAISRTRSGSTAATPS